MWRVTASDLVQWLCRVLRFLKKKEGIIINNQRTTEFPFHDQRDRVKHTETIFKNFKMRDTSGMTNLCADVDVLD